jgi:hypothetical protein
MLRLLLLLSSFYFIACGNKTTKEPQTELKDIVAQKLLDQADWNEFYDTTDINFKILKAYRQNDQQALQKLNAELDAQRRDTIHRDKIDTCVKLEHLSRMKVDEVYRFRHSQSFCKAVQIVTISKANETYRLHYLEFLSVSNPKESFPIVTKDGDTINMTCIKAKEFEMPITKDEWGQLEKKVELADYWGLKPRNFQFGFDGSSWTIDAFTKRYGYITTQQVHSVFRWSPENEFAELGVYFMKLAREKGMCNSFF